jgi:hypothetical protein
MYAALQGAASGALEPKPGRLLDVNMLQFAAAGEDATTQARRLAEAVARFEHKSIAVLLGIAFALVRMTAAMDIRQRVLKDLIARGPWNEGKHAAAGS